jgi:surface polysaccharide O-acyltransferase-like enzyme
VVVLALRRERLSLREFVSVASSLKMGYIQHLWYMPVFFVLCLLTPVLQALRQHSPQVYRYGMVILLVYTFGNLLLSDLEYLLRWVTGHLGHTGNREFFWYTNFFGSHYWYAFVYYGLGVFLVSHREDLPRYRVPALVAIPLCMGCLTLFALARCHVRGETFDPVFNNYSNIFTLILTAAILTLCLECRPGPRLCRWSQSLSRCSLGIYLLHWLIIEALLDYLPGLTSWNRLAPLVAIPVLGLSWGLTWCFQRIPGVRCLFSLSVAKT